MTYKHIFNLLALKILKEIIHNPSYDTLYAHETNADLEGYERGQVSNLGAVNVLTGQYTGRSPKDKFTTLDDTTKDTLWWNGDVKNDNKPISPEVWGELKSITMSQLSGKRLYVVDGFCGANDETRLAVRFIMEVAWQAHFVTNMFIRPSAEELENFNQISL